LLDDILPVSVKNILLDDENLNSRPAITEQYDSVTIFFSDIVGKRSSCITADQKAHRQYKPLIQRYNVLKLHCYFKGQGLTSDKESFVLCISSSE
jgi:hypothetical protein